MAKTLVRNASVKKEASVRAGEILSFSSAIIVIVVSAIFYLAGWFYLAHWYAFFGIDATQINLPNQTVIVHGLPSILILIVSGLLSVSLVAIWKIVKSVKRIEKKDFPTIVIMAYIIAFLIMGVSTIIYTVSTNNIIPVEVIFALVLFYVIAILIYQLILASSYLIGESKFHIPGLYISVMVPRAYAINGLFAKYAKQGEYKLAAKLWINLLLSFFDILTTTRTGIFKSIKFDIFSPIKIGDKIEKEIRTVEKKFIQLMKSQKKQLTVAFTETWQFWVGAILILYLLVSVSTSAIFGQWDAVRGKRLLVGDWQIPEISLYSTSTIPALQEFETQSNPEYEYKSLGLLASDNNVYYLVDLKTAEYYQQKPKVYIVPRNDNLMLNFIVSYYKYPTPTLKPSLIQTDIPTITPTVSVTVTPTP